ncbi:hypothetical protein BCR35DRAFT_301586 [Leucosporidium creatinivorum]|uniref:Transmembrane protein n=1 Tax=Leucosporidium creatinivorum TaxID=106004 RepID=A0A1Y2FWT6_9BASI|nr:hypothetical protein BCR35DRAFT_301586 [Leucosporidium creatinivorum]
MPGNDFHPLSDSAASNYSTSLYARDEEEDVPHQQQRDSLASVQEEGMVHPLRQEEGKSARPPPPPDYRPELKMHVPTAAEIARVRRSERFRRTLFMVVSFIGVSTILIFTILGCKGML